MKKRCFWVDDSFLYQHYHDTEWGIGEYNALKLFELLSLEIFQAGLSWITVLKKREYFRQAFDNFNPSIIANYTDNKVNELLGNEKIIRHKGKILATIHNAKIVCDVFKIHNFPDYLWGYVNHTPIKNHFSDALQVPSQTELSTIIAKDLKNKGFKFCGTKIIYAFMQASGMVNDHLTDCFKYTTSS